MSLRIRMLFSLSILLPANVHAQSNVDPVNKWAWGENIGWCNWRDAHESRRGVVVGETFLSGYIWGENVGWINAGDGSPKNGVRYANANGSDFGVNVDSNRDLYGFAWGENIGWVNFDARQRDAQRGRVEQQQRRLLGFAWGENVSSINLDDTRNFVALTDEPTPGPTEDPGRQIPGDCNQDRALDIADGVCVFGTLFLGSPRDFPCGDGRPGDVGNLALLDWQSDRQIDLSDGVAMLQFLFSGGPPHTLAVVGSETTACVPMLGCPDKTSCP